MRSSFANIPKVCIFSFQEKTVDKILILYGNLIYEKFFCQHTEGMYFSFQEKTVDKILILYENLMSEKFFCLLFLKEK